MLVLKVPTEAIATAILIREVAPDIGGVTTRSESMSGRSGTVYSDTNKRNDSARAIARPYASIRLKNGGNLGTNSGTSGKAIRMPQRAEHINPHAMVIAIATD